MGTKKSIFIVSKNSGKIGGWRRKSLSKAGAYIHSLYILTILGENIVFNLLNPVTFQASCVPLTGESRLEILAGSSIIIISRIPLSGGTVWREVV